MVQPSLNIKMGLAETTIFCVFILQGAWCEEWSISLPEKIEALSGSCVTINCTFKINNKYDNDLTESAAGVWYKDGTTDNYIVFNSNFNLSLKGKITGKLKDKNCTTIFYNVTSNQKGKFFFRIEGSSGLKWTYTQKAVSIDVIDSPHKPTVQMFKDQMEVQVQKEVLEGSSMRLRCSANKTLCSSSPPTLTWSSTDRLHLNDSSRLQLDQQKQTEIISDLNFTATHLQHGVTFICTITYQLQQRNKTAQRNITLRVQYAPKNTSVFVFPSNSVLEGSSVTLICSSDGNPAVFNYTWYRENGGQLEELQTGYNLTFNVTDCTHTGNYYCQARNQHGTQNTSVLLDIQYAPKNTSVSVFPSNSVLEGSSVTLICSSDGNPAVLIYTWYRENGGQLKEKTGYNLTFSVTNRTQTGRYYCQTKNQHGIQNTSVLLDIQYAPQISDSFICTHGDVNVFTCEVHGNPSPKVKWFLSGRPVSNSTNIAISEERLKSTDLRSVITLHQSLTHTDTLQCVTTNTHGTTSIEFHLFQDTAWFNINSMLVGLAVGALVTAILCLTIYMYNRWICWTGREDTTGLILKDKAILQENDEPVYANKVMPAGDTTLNYPESLNYSSIDFKNNTAGSGENGGASSLGTDYAVIKHGGHTVLGEDTDIKRAESKSRNKSAPDNADLYAKVQHHHS